MATVAVNDTSNAKPNPDPNLDLDDVMPSPPFRERHRRTVAAPIEEVWPHCLGVTASEIRTLGPLLALRGVPALLRSKRAPRATAPAPLLDVFASQGFVILRRDEEPVDGRAVVLFGATGRFWSVTENAAVTFDAPGDLLAFDQPGYATTVARLEAIDLGDGTTRIQTETRVAGTDPASTRRFAPYWAIIRLPSGLIRRSWLAAIARRVSR